MFADIDESIRQLLVQMGNLNSGEIDIAFDMPTRDWAAGINKPTVNAYLYDIRENVELRVPKPFNVRRGPGNTAIMSRPDFRVDLTYRITAFANAIEDEHRLLSRVLLTLLQHPILPQSILGGLVEGQEIQTFTARPDGLVQTPADYWGALDNDIKPSIDYQLITRVNLNQEHYTGLALTSTFKVGATNGKARPTEFNEVPLTFGGTVHVADDPESGIEGVSVTLLERALDAVTDNLGRFRFGGVPPGTYTLVVSSPDIEERSQQIEVPGASYDIGV